MKDPLFSKLSVAKRAGLLESGFDRVKDTVSSGGSALVITASDISPKTLKEVRFFCSDSVEVLETSRTMDEFGAAVGARAAVYSLNDRGFAEAIKKALGCDGMCGKHIGHNTITEAE